MVVIKNNIKYAAFIITYERPEILLNTIQEIFQQTLPPEKVLIVDNSESRDTDKLIKKLNHPKVEYYKVGYNAGPSGGAYIGLQKLGKENYPWFFWVDDDNPPEDKNTIERLFQITSEIDGETCGQIGLVGSKFNKWTGEIKRLEDEELSQDIIEVDTIGGGQCKIISSKVVRKGILPEEKLFFGFEDLDIDIKIKKAGFKSYVSGSMLYESRKSSNRLNLETDKQIKVDNNSLNRLYYSVRSLLTIFYKNAYLTALLYLSIKKLGASILAFKSGPRAGFKHFKVVCLAYYHFLINKYGKVNLNL